MARKQIDNYIFDYKKDNTVDFIAPDGFTLKLSKTEADYKYKRMWLAKNLDKLCFDTVKELGFTNFRTVACDPDDDKYDVEIVLWKTLTIRLGELKNDDDIAYKVSFVKFPALSNATK